MRGSGKNTYQSWPCTRGTPPVLGCYLGLRGLDQSSLALKGCIRLHCWPALKHCTRPTIHIYDVCLLGSIPVAVQVPIHSVCDAHCLRTGPPSEQYSAQKRQRVLASSSFPAVSCLTCLPLGL